MSKQDEFIKQLYYGDDLLYENTRKDSSKKCELNKIRDEIHKKIMKALIQVYGEEEANKINEEWIGCSSEIEIENEIVIFKEALYLGYDLADVFLIEDRKYMLGNFKKGFLFLFGKDYGKNYC